MNWFFIALLPPVLWSISNHFDKYLLSRFFKAGGVGALMVFSSLVGVFLLPIIAILHPEVLHFSNHALFISLNGFVYILSILPYFYALQKDEASICVPIFQLIPVFSFFLAYLILGETLTTNQILGGLIIVFGAIAISLDIPDRKKIKLKKEIFGLMMLSSLMFALNFLFFKYFAIQSDFWFTSFWEYVGFAIFATLLMLFIRPYREQFIAILKTNKGAILGLNGMNEIVNIVAKISFNFVSLLIPVTLVWIVDGFQPFFIFIFGVLLTLFFPKISQEDISKRALLQKILAIFIMFIGAYLINKN